MSSGDSSSSSSPPTTMLPSPATREKKVYVCVTQFLTDCHKHELQRRPDTNAWYAIDNNDDDSAADEEKCDDEKVEPPLDLDPVFKAPSGSPTFFGGVASCESFIYQFGGQHSKPFYQPIPTSNVFHIDTRSPQDGWTSGPNLKIPRKYPHGVVYDGKICVLGGTSERDHSIYGESLKPLSDHRWWRMDMGRPQDDPPTYMSGHAIFSDKLFLHQFASESLYCYDFNDDTWSTVVRGGFDWTYPCASIDEMMYFVEGKRFMAFDLIKHQWYKVVGLEENGMLPPFYGNVNCFAVPSSLLHLGNGTLCLIWIRVLSVAYSVIYCTKFTVCKQYDKKTQKCSIIKAIVKSFKVYRIQGGQLEACLAVDAGEESDYEKEEGETEEQSAKVQMKSVVVTKKFEEGKLPMTKMMKKNKIKQRRRERL